MAFTSGATISFWLWRAPRPKDRQPRPVLHMTAVADVHPRALGSLGTRMYRLDDGAPHPLGATWDGKGTNFALFSAHATKVELCLFDKEGRREIERIALPERSE